jgi:pyruvate formate lyase activating enzyme
MQRKLHEIYRKIPLKNKEKAVIIMAVSMMMAFFRRRAIMEAAFPHDRLTGRIFSIEEFSTYDGPGIRMTVFLKGCSLRCMWCHNPEGQRWETETVRSPNGCLACGACLRKGEELTGVPSLVPESASVCPRRLIRVSGEDLTPEQLVEERIVPNLAILNMSGGGVTFSGGEPLCQADFVLAAMELLRGRTNRAIQTAGHVPERRFRRVLAECDYVLYDLKLMDSEKHRRYTMAGNEWILENYRTLTKSGVPFTTRIPLIPSVNDTEENIEATARFLQECGVSYIELLPYNQMAGGKYRMLGREYTIDFDPSLAPNAREEIFHRYGVEVKIL